MSYWWYELPPLEEGDGDPGLTETPSRDLKMLQSCLGLDLDKDLAWAPTQGLTKALPKSLSRGLDEGLTRL